MRSPFTRPTKCCTCGLSVGFSAAQSNKLATNHADVNHFTKIFLYNNTEVVEPAQDTLKAVERKESTF